MVHEHKRMGVFKRIDFNLRYCILIVIVFQCMIRIRVLDECVEYEAQQH